MRTPHRLRTLLDHEAIPATIQTITLPSGAEVTVCLTLTENPHQDIHETRRMPSPVETAETFAGLHKWASMIPAI